MCLIDTALARLVNANAIPPHSSHFITLIFTVNFSFLSCFGKNYFSFSLKHALKFMHVSHIHQKWSFFFVVIAVNFFRHARCEQFA